jgi:hypothetical protein
MRRAKQLVRYESQIINLFFLAWIEHELKTSPRILEDEILQLTREQFIVGSSFHFGMVSVTS